MSKIDQLMSCHGVVSCQRFSFRKANVLKRGYSSSKHFQHSAWSGNWGAGAGVTSASKCPVLDPNLGPLTLVVTSFEAGGYGYCSIAKTHLELYTVCVLSALMQ